MAPVTETKRPIEVDPGDGYSIRLRYDDGAAGVVDLSDMAGRGVFGAWKDRSLFEAVHLPPYRGVSWPGELDLCAGMLYMRLTGKSHDDLHPSAVAV